MMGPMPAPGAERPWRESGRTLLAMVVATVAGWLVSASAQSTPPLTLQFHHVHYHVGDPSAAMGEAVRRVEGVRVIVPGMGVGVRAGREFLLFDRLEVDAAPSSGGSAVASFPVAVAKLKSLGFAVVPDEVSHVKVITAMADLPVHHVAFAAEDLPRAVQRMLDRGTAALAQREDAVLFDAGGGLAIEIVRDTTRPDVYWCPMHPDVRAADPVACILCGMDLVPIPPPKVGEYRLDVGLERDGRDRRIRAMRLQVREPGTNAAVSRFATVHEKPFHLFVISRDLTSFDHVHPEQQPDGSFTLTHALPPGEYMLIADFLPEGGTPQMVQRAIISGSAADLPRGPAPTVVAAAPVRSAEAGGLRVKLEAGVPVAGKELPLTFTVSDVRTGEPVTDLEPFLGAPAHLLIVRRDLEDAIHAHPEEQATGGPTVSFHPLIPSAGDYRMWIQFQRSGRVITVPFALPAAR